MVGGSGVCGSRRRVGRQRVVLVLAIEGVVMLAASATTLSDIRYFVCRVSRLVFYVGACSIYGVTFQSHSLFDSTRGRKSLRFVVAV